MFARTRTGRSLQATFEVSPTFLDVYTYSWIRNDYGLDAVPTQISVYIFDFITLLLIYKL